MNYSKKFFFSLLCLLSKLALCQCAFNIGPDLLFCPDQLINAYFEAPKGGTSYKWNTGETSQGITVNAAGTYFCTGTFLSSNLIVNGDFNSGDSGFSSSYTVGLGGPYGPLSLESTYFISDNPTAAHTDFPRFGDHTSGNGSMLLVNGSGIPNASAWCQSVTVTPFTDYNFSTWVATCVASSNAEIAKLQFSINGSLLGSPFSPSFTPGQWLPFNATWNSGNSTLASICIVNQNTAFSGNDFALDDIFFQSVCKYSDTVEVKLKPLPIITISKPQMLTCAFPSTTLNTFCSVSGAVYSWTGPSGFSSSLQNPSVSKAGIYSVTVITADGCSASATVEVTGNSGTPEIIICQDKTLTCVTKDIDLSGLSPTIGATYTWSGPGGFSANSATVNVAAIGTYTLTVADTLSGCSSSATVTVNGNFNLPDVHAGDDMSLTCLIKSRLLSGASATSGIQYLWNGPAGFISTQLNPIVSIPGIYILTVTNPTNGCVSIDSTTLLPAASPVVATISKTDVNCYKGMDGTAAIQILSGGTAPFNFYWNTGSTTSKISSIAAGNYTCIATDALGCMDTLSIAIKAPSQLILSPINSYTICPGQSVTISPIASGGIPGYLYRIFDKNFIEVGDTITPDSSTDYFAIATDQHGCVSDALPFSIKVFSKLSVSSDDVTPICEGQCVYLSVNVKGGKGNYTYTWLPGNETTSSLKVCPVITTSYTVNVNDECGKQQKEITVPVIPLPQPAIVVSDTGGCSPLCIDVRVDGVFGMIYSWYIDNKNKGAAVGFNDCLSEGDHVIRISVINSIGCAGADTINVHAYPVPVAIFHYSPEDPTILNSEVNFINESLGATSYIWDLGTGQQSIDTNPFCVYPKVKNCYNVTLQAFNEYGCMSKTDREVCIKDIFTIYFPNAFSPDNDGINDTFKPKGVGIDSEFYSFSIFDRWGNLLFETSDFEKGWDGKCLKNNEYEPIDCYVWKCSLRDIGGRHHHYKGIVTLVK